LNFKQTLSNRLSTQLTKQLSISALLCGALAPLGSVQAQDLPLTAPGLRSVRSVLVATLPSERKELDKKAPQKASQIKPPASAAETSTPATHQTALATITATDYKKHIETLADDTLEGRDSGSRGGRAAGNYLIAALREYGLTGAAAKGSFVQTFQQKGRGMRNILGLLEGSDPELKNEVIVIGAHYDHVGYGTAQTSRGRVGYIHNGADDNASGVAAVLETVQAIRALPTAPRRSILVAFWDGEEQGLLGSKHWVAHPTIDMNRVVFAFNCDMIGRLTDAGVVVHGTRTAPGLRRLVAEANKKTDLKLDFQWKLAMNSDHAPFFEQQKPVLMFHTGLHSDYHTPRDDAHLINTAGATRVTRLLFEAITRVADRATVFAYRGKAATDNDFTREQFSKPLPQPAPRLGMRWQRGDNGAVVTAVTPGSAASRAGLKIGDRLLKFNGAGIDSDFAFLGAIVASQTEATATVERDGKEPETIKIQLDGSPLRVGISWREDPAEQGVMFVSRTVSGSPAHAANLRAGDRIHTVGGEPIRDIQHMARLVAEAKEQLDLIVERDGQIRSVKIKLQ